VTFPGLFHTAVNLTAEGGAFFGVPAWSV